MRKTAYIIAMDFGTPTLWDCRIQEQPFTEHPIRFTGSAGDSHATSGTCTMAAVLRAIFGYVFLVLMVRIAGRRPGKQITPFEFVLIFYMGGLTLTAMVADDRSLTNALIQIASIAGTHWVMAWLRQRSETVGKILDGTPLVLLKDGQWQMETMNRMLLQDDDVMAAARDKGMERLDQIGYAILERNGEITIVAKQEKP